MIRTRKSWLRAVGCIVAPLVVLTACMGDTSDDDSSAPSGETDEDDSATAAQTDDSAEPVTLRMSVWTGNEEQLAVLNEIADEYASQDPSVEGVEFESRDPAEYTTALTTQIAGGNPPDLGWVFEQDAKQFIESGALVDLGPAMSSDDYGLDDFADSALELWADGDAVYGYPFSTSPFGIFYNADVFAAAGVPNPDELIADGDWTWERLAEVGGDVVDAGEARAGFGFQRFDFQEWASLAIIWRSFGAHAWSADGTECQLTEPEMVEAMDFFHGMIFDQRTHPEPGTSADFFAGEAAMIAAQISRAGLAADAGFEWGLVPLPSGPAAQAAVIGQAGIGVFSAGDNHEAATGFLTFLTNEENAAKLAQFWPPPRMSLLNAEDLAETNPQLSAEQIQDVVIEGISSGEVLPSHPNQAKLSDSVRAELDALWVADADVADVLAQTCDVIEPLLSGQ